MDHSDIDHENMTSAYLKVIRGEKKEILKEIVTQEGEWIDEARLVTRDGKFIVLTDNDTEAATFEDRESALEYIKNNKEKLMVRDDKAKPATNDKVEAKEGKEIFIVPEEIVDTKERNAFMGAAAAAHKAGKSHFNFAGKKHKVTMGSDTAKAINNSVKEAHAKVDQFTGHKHAKRAGINVKTHGSSMGGHGDDVTLSHPDKKKLQKYVSNHLDGETQGIKVKEMVNPQANLTKTQRQALSRMKVKKNVTLPGMDLLKKDEKPKMKPGRQSQIVKYEGYEADVSKFMNKHGIDHHWSGGKLHVDKKDHAHAEKKLKKKYGGYGPRGAKMMPQLHVNKESTMVTRSNWLERFYEKRNSVNEDYKKSPHAGGDDTKDSIEKQLSTRKGEQDFYKAHEIQTPEYADGPAVNMKTFAAMTAGVKGPKYRSNDNTQGDKTPVAPVKIGKAGGVGAKD